MKLLPTQIMLLAALTASAQTPPATHNKPAAKSIGPWIEKHCVAVLMNDDTFRIAEGASYTAPKVEYSHDKNGNRIAHVPEQLLKLRCK